MELRATGAGTAAPRHTKSLSNHFALLPRSHRGPVSVLAGCLTLFISASGSYLLSPGPRIKDFGLLQTAHLLIFKNVKFSSKTANTVSEFQPFDDLDVQNVSS